MLWLLLALFAPAQEDRTVCERRVGSHLVHAGVFASARADCSAEQGSNPETFEKGLCKQARLGVILPDPYAEDRVKIELIESRRDLRLKDLDAPTGRTQINPQNNWLVAGQPIELVLGSGDTLSLPLLERAQARVYWGGARERLVWTVRVKLTADDARKMGREGILRWSYEAPGLRASHPVKKMKKLGAAVDCVLGG
ncbi:MAG: hypothetical protein AB8H79_23505 [Myxococcota bacterium]